MAGPIIELLWRQNRRLREKNRLLRETQRHLDAAKRALGVALVENTALRVHSEMCRATARKFHDRLVVSDQLLKQVKPDDVPEVKP